jgi:hypothetical protein
MYHADPGSDFWFAVVILIISISYWAAGKTNGVAFSAGLWRIGRRRVIGLARRAYDAA